MKNSVGIVLALSAAAITGGPQAVASSLISFTPASCFAGSAGDAGLVDIGGCAIDSLSTPVNGVTGVELQGSATNNNITATSNGGAFGVYLNESGATSGTSFAGTIPVSWDFSATSSDGGNVAYALQFVFTGNLASTTLNEGNINLFDIASGSTVASNDVFSGATGLGSTITGYQIVFEVLELNSTAGGTLTVNMQPGGLEINAPSNAPEPGSLLLLGTGAAVFLLMRIGSGGGTFIRRS